MPEVNQGIINYGSIGGNASVRIVHGQEPLADAFATLRSSGHDPELVSRLIALVCDLQARLQTLPPSDAASIAAVTRAVKNAMSEVSSGAAPDKGSLQISAKGLLEAAKGLAEVMPIATKIAASLAAAFGFAI